jgi:branched-chain amino acid transport system permease protein
MGLWQRNFISPILVGLIGIAFERFILRRFYSADPIISLLLTFGLSMVIEQLIRMAWGAAPLASSIPTALKGKHCCWRVPLFSL